MIREVIKGWVVVVLLCVAPIFASAEVLPEISVQRDIGRGNPGSLAVSTDGAIIAIRPYLSNYLLIDKATKRVIRELPISSIDYLAFSADGNSLFARYDNDVEQWSTSGEKLYVYEGKRGYGLAVSPDGQYVAFNEGSYADKTPDSHIKIMDTRTHDLVRNIPIGASNNIFQILAFRPDNRVLASVEVPSGRSSHDASILKIWDVKTGELVRTLPEVKNNSGWHSIAFSSDGQWLACVGSTGWVGRIDIFDVASGRLVDSKIDKSIVSVDYVKFSPDGSLMATGNYATSSNVSMWQVGSWKQLYKVTKASGDIAFINNNELLANTDVLDTRTGKKLYSMSMTMDEQSRFNNPAISQESGLLALTTDAKNTFTIRVFDLKNGRELFQIIDDQNKLNGSNASHLTFNSDGSLLAAVIHQAEPSGVPDQNVAEVWDMHTRRKIFKYLSSCGIQNLSFGNNGSLAFACIEQTSREKQKLEVVLLSSNGVRLNSQWRADEISMSCSSGSGCHSQISELTFSADGKLIAYKYDPGNGKSHIEIRDVSNGELIKSLDFGYATAMRFSQDGLHFGASKSGYLGMDKVKIWGTQDWHEEFNWEGLTDGIRQMMPSQSFFTPDLSKCIFSKAGKYLSVLDTNTQKVLLNKEEKIDGTSGITGVSFSLKGTLMSTTNMGKHQGVSLWHLPDLKQVASIAPAGKHEYIILTPEGYYNASSQQAEKFINLTVGSKVFRIENYREKFYRPDLVQLALSGQALPTELAGGINKVGVAPAVSLINLPASINDDNLTLQLKIQDQGGGVGDVRVYINGTAVQGKAARGLTVTNSGKAGDILSIPVKLVSGKNDIKVIVFNAENSMSSNPAEATVISNAKVQRKPQLHALVVGIQEFENISLNLKYSRGDAQAIKQMLEQQSKGLFDQVNVQLLTDKANTSKAAIEAAFASYKANVAPDDVFLFYVASHGIVDGETMADKSYYLITSNVGSTATRRIKQDALSQETLRRLIADVPATKKLVLLDTCHAGDVGSKLLGRGLDEDSAVKLLSRSTGIAVIAASTSTQQALEGHHGHGVFTYVLLEGLAGKADTGKKGYVTPISLADYVTEQVPEVTEHAFKSKQYPTFNIEGQPFPIVKSR